jgi:hypothetical protein
MPPTSVAGGENAPKLVPYGLVLRTGIADTSWSLGVDGALRRVVRIAEADITLTGVASAAVVIVAAVIARLSPPTSHAARTSFVTPCAKMKFEQLRDSREIFVSH